MLLSAPCPPWAAQGLKEIDTVRSTLTCVLTRKELWERKEAGLKPRTEPGQGGSGSVFVVQAYSTWNVDIYGRQVVLGGITVDKHGHFERLSSFKEMTDVRLYLRASNKRSPANTFLFC